MATIIRNNIIKRYKVSNESTVVTFSGTLGYGHPSGSTVKLEGEVIYESNKSNWTTEIGLCKDLKGKKMECIVTVHDSQPNPNTSIDWEVSGCSHDSLKQSDAYPGAKDDIIIYNFTVYFN